VLLKQFGGASRLRIEIIHQHAAKPTQLDFIPPSEMMTRSRSCWHPATKDAGKILSRAATATIGAARDMGLESPVSKHRDRPYQIGRSKHWVKVKNRKLRVSLGCRKLTAAKHPTGFATPVAQNPRSSGIAFGVWKSF
jgi:hypothetical protein